MSYTNQTSHLGLPQWILTDKPQMEDYNSAFKTIDTGMESLLEKLGNKTEESSGLWVPELRGVISSGEVDYLSRSGLWLKVGRLLFASFYLRLNSDLRGITDDDRLIVSGLPTTLGAAAYDSYMQLGYAHNIPQNSLQNTVSIAAQISKGSNNLYLSRQLTAASGCFMEPLRPSAAKASFTIGGTVTFAL